MIVGGITGYFQGGAVAAAGDGPAAAGRRRSSRSSRHGAAVGSSASDWRAGVAVKSGSGEEDEGEGKEEEAAEEEPGKFDRSGPRPPPLTLQMQLGLAALYAVGFSIVIAVATAPPARFLGDHVAMTTCLFSVFCGLDHSWAWALVVAPVAFALSRAATPAGRAQFADSTTGPFNGPDEHYQTGSPG